MDLLDVRTPTFDRISNEIIETGRTLADHEYHAARAGNISAQLSSELVICTRHRADKGKLTPDDLIICNLQGERVAGSGEPTSEMGIHLACYRARSDVRAVIHAHPPHATGFAAASTPLDQVTLPELVVWLGPVGFVPYAAPGGSKLAELVSQCIVSHDALLLENHGALTVGRDLQQAAERMELLEHSARLTLVARQLGKVFRLSSAEMEELLEIRRRVHQAPAVF
jgi:L-fuculose-phosphate aldolase